MNDKASRLSREALDFAPGLLSIQEDPPRRLPRTVLYVVIALFVIALLWMAVGRIDIVATATGQLKPQTYVKIVQPADSGIVERILVHEDEHVRAGQVLMRMDPGIADADSKTLQTKLALSALRLRRIDAELSGGRMVRRASDPPDLYRQVERQLRAHRQAYLQALDQARDDLSKAKGDFAAAKQVLVKLKEVTPILRRQADAYAGMGKEGYVPAMTVDDKQRAYLQSAQDLSAQRDTVQGLAAAVAAARRRVAQVTAKYRSALHDEWVATEGKYRTLQQDWAKQQHKNALLELRAPQAGIVQNLATHTVGTVVSPGTVLLSLVPDSEPLIAVVRIKNADVGFVHVHQKVRVKIAAYPFERYGMLDGTVLDVSPDASSGGNGGNSASRNNNASNSAVPPTTSYKALIALDSQSLNSGQSKLPLVAGMQVSAEIVEGKRSVLEYLLSPVAKTLDNSGRER
jgi:HlyD family secretion protein